MGAGFLAPEIVLVLAAFAVLGVFVFTGRKKLSGIVALLGLLASGAALAVLALSGRTGEAWSSMVVFDPFAVVFKVIFLIIAFLVISMSLDFVHRQIEHAGEFFALILFATVGMFFMASSPDLITIYIGLELMSISSYVLAGMLKEDDRSVEASMKYFLMGATTSALLLFGLSLLFGLTGTTNLAEMARQLGESPANNPPLLAALAFLVAGFGFKIAVVPFHMWAPDAYHGAPTPISALLITGSEAAAFAALLRVFTVGLPILQPTWTAAFALVAFITMTYGNITALVQTNVKRMLAYSAIAQAGYVLVGAAVATVQGVTAMLYYLLAYAFMTTGAFAVVIMLGRNVPGDEIDNFKGLSQRSPWTALALTVFFLSLIGIPPTAGFFGKFWLFSAAIQSGLLWLAVAMVVNSVISVAYYYSVVRNMYLVEVEPVPIVVPAGVKLAIGVALAAVLVLGLYPEPFLSWIAGAISLPLQ